MAETKTKAKVKAEKPKAAKVIKAKAVKAPKETLAFNISGCSPKLVRALDKAAKTKAKTDGHRISRSRLVVDALNSQFL